MYRRDTEMYLAEIMSKWSNIDIVRNGFWVEPRIFQQHFV